MYDSELNDWLAINVMGWHKKDREYINENNISIYNDNSQGFNWLETWNPTDNLNQAMMCVEKLQADKIVLFMIDIDGLYHAELHMINGEVHYGERHDSVPKAICDMIVEAYK